MVTPAEKFKAEILFIFTARSCQCVSVMEIRDARLLKFSKNYNFSFRASTKRSISIRYNGKQLIGLYCNNLHTSRVDIVNSSKTGERDIYN